MDYMRDRIKEGSTWAGIGVLVAAIQHGTQTNDWSQAFMVVIPSLIAMFRKS